MSAKRRLLEAHAKKSPVPADWMSHFSHVPLPNMIMPGAHDAAAHELETTAAPDCDLENAAFWVSIPFLSSCCVRPWCVTQSGPAEALLRCGCRYFDLRLGVDDRISNRCGERFRLCHGLLGPGLGQWLGPMKAFLDAHPTEVVCLEVKFVQCFVDAGGRNASINGVSEKDHQDVLDCIVGALGGAARFVPAASRCTPLGELVRAHQQVHLVYCDACPGGTMHEYAAVCHPSSVLRSHWPNKCDAQKVVKELDEELVRSAAGNADRFLVLQGVLTPGGNDIVRGIAGCGACADGSIRDLAKRIAPELCMMLSRPDGAVAQHLRHGAIVMVDFASESFNDALMKIITDLNYGIHKQRVTADTELMSEQQSGSSKTLK